MKNRLCNKVLAELNVKQKINKSHKILYILYWSCAFCWTFITYEVMSKAPEACFKITHFELLCHALALQWL